MKEELNYCFQLKSNPTLFYSSNGPSLYPDIFVYGEQSDAQNIRVSNLYTETTDIPNVTAEQVEKLKVIRASLLPYYGNSFSKKYNMWDKHVLSPNYTPLDSDATNLGSFMHLLFEYDGNPPEGTYVCKDWGTTGRANSKGYQKLRKEVTEKYGDRLPIINLNEFEMAKNTYLQAVKEIDIKYKDVFELGKSWEHTRLTIPNYLNTGWALSGQIDKVKVTAEGRHRIHDMKSVDPTQLSSWDSGTRSLAEKMLQLEFYRILYSHTYNVPLDIIDICFVLIIRTTKKQVLGDVVRIIEPSIQYTEQKHEMLQRLFVDTAEFFEDRVNNKPYGIDIVKYNPIHVRTKLDVEKYNYLFETLEKLCEEKGISFLEGKDYFEAGDYKVLSYKLLIAILYSLGHECNVISVREHDSLKYVSDDDNLYYRKYEDCSSPNDNILYYCSEIKDIGAKGIKQVAKLSPIDVDKYVNMFGSYFKNNYYNQLAYVTVIKHSIRTFMFESALLETFVKLESMTYEGMKNE